MAKNTIQSKFKKQLHGNKFPLIFVGVIVLTGGLLLYKALSLTQTKTVTVQKQVLMKRSIDLGIINRGLTGKAVDVSTGKIVKAARIFTENDNTIYLQLDLNTAPAGTVIDYIRYKDGRYVDHGEVTLANDNTKNLLFNWTINKLLANVRNGKWKVSTYTNGILAKRVLYEVKNSAVSYVYPDGEVSANDSDYSLQNALSGK